MADNELARAAQQLSDLLNNSLGRDRDSVNTVSPPITANNQRTYSQRKSMAPPPIQLHATPPSASGSAGFGSSSPRFGLRSPQPSTPPAMGRQQQHSPAAQHSSSPRPDSRAKELSHSSSSNIKSSSNNNNNRISKKQVQQMTERMEKIQHKKEQRLAQARLLKTAEELEQMRAKPQILRRSRQIASSHYIPIHRRTQEEIGKRQDTVYGLRAQLGKLPEDPVAKAESKSLVIGPGWQGSTRLHQPGSYPIVDSVVDALENCDASCTFEPVINPQSHQVSSERPNSALYAWDSICRRRVAASDEKRQEQEQAELDQCTFQPQINHKSQEMVQARPTDKSVGERLYEHSIKQKAVKEHEEKMIAEHLLQQTIPNINQRSQHLQRGDVWERLHINAPNDLSACSRAGNDVQPALFVPMSFDLGDDIK